MLLCRRDKMSHHYIKKGEKLLPEYCTFDTTKTSKFYV